MTARRIIAATAVAGALVCALATPAAAHVTIDPSSVPAGSTVRLSFLVPNEQPPATVTDVKIFFPTPPAAPFPAVTVGQKPGWTATVTMQHLAKPLTTPDGEVSDIVSAIEWKATAPASAVKNGEFGEFTVDADGVPDGPQVVFKAVQTYSNGNVVRWIDPVTAGGPEAQHPTPILDVTPASAGSTPTSTPATTGSATTSSTSASTKDSSARALGVVALVVGAVALLAATGALMRRRRAG